MQNNFATNGSGADRAISQGYQALEGLVMKQASLLTYMDVFLGIGIFFALCVPFVLILKPARGKVDTSQAAH
jgi:DHA2 family multidrug resistance protein